MNWHTQHEKGMSIGDRIADSVASFTGSWKCVWLHTVWFLLWFDFGLDINVLTLIVSLEAIYLCVFLLMNSNRQSDRDRHQAEADYRTNREAEERIEELQRHLSYIELEKLDTILRLLVEPTMRERKRKR